MDVNLGAEGKAKTIGMQPPPAMAQEERQQSRVQTVQPGNESARGDLNDKTLQGRASNQQEMSRDELDRNVKEIQDRFDDIGTSLGFSVKENPEAVVVEVKDNKTGKVISQIPSKEVLDLRAKLNDLVGILFDKKA